VQETERDAAIVTIIGVGPRGTGVLERLLANVAAEPLGRPLEVHLVDPYPPGAGRVWRRDQSALLWLNSTAEDVTLFADDSVQLAGPHRAGPSFHEWVANHGDPVDALSFPSRHDGFAYLSWVYDEITRDLPPRVSIVVHTDRAVDITADATDGTGGAAQLVHLEVGSEPIRSDAVVITIGHLDAHPSDPERELADFARRHGGAYLPPAYGADVDLDAFAPGADVIVRGFGLAFVDLLVLLTEGRGGWFTERTDGSLRYHPSGREPRVVVGSRRGVPYRCKPTYRLQGPPLQLPRFFAPDAVTALLEHRDRIDFCADVWPLIAKEVLWGYYQELFAAHPDRTRLPWRDFEARFAPLAFGAAELDALVVEAVTDPADRLDLAGLDRPLAGVHFTDHLAFRAHLRAHVRADIDRRNDPSFSADLGAFLAFLSVFGQLPRVLGSRKLEPRSRIEGFDQWWFGFFSYYASGPPPARLEQLLALLDAGVVDAIGADMWVELDERTGCFRAGSPTTPQIVEAKGLIDARLPDPTMERTTDPLLFALWQRGEARELILHADDGTPLRTGQLLVTPHEMRVVDAEGQPHPRRYAAGPHTTARAPAFARPHTDAPVFRGNDALARALLAELREAVEAVEAGAAGNLVTTVPPKKGT
jgi:hypothetical protein